MKRTGPSQQLATDERGGPQDSLPAEDARELLVFEDPILDRQHTGHAQMPYASQRRFRVVRFHGDEQGISGLDLVRVRRDRDRHGEVDEPGDDDPVVCRKAARWPRAMKSTSSPARTRCSPMMAPSAPAPNTMIFMRMPFCVVA